MIGRREEEGSGVLFVTSDSRSFEIGSRLFIINFKTSQGTSRRPGGSSIEREENVERRLIFAINPT